MVRSARHGWFRHAARLLVFLCSLSGLLAAGCPASAAGIVEGPYLQNATAAAVTVCWVSDNRATGSVTWVLAERAPAGKPLQGESLRQMVATRYHRVRLTGLKPYTRYAYQVDCEGQRATGSFVTAPRPGRPFRFVAYGDNRSQPERHAAVIARLMRFQPDLVINTGDQVANGSNEQQWLEFFRVAGPMLRDAPYYPELGNHEGEGQPYFRYFSVPRDYSFDYGDAHFVGLDTNRPESEWAAQEAWLRRDLAEHQNATWRIVFCHHPFYTCTTIRGRREGAAELRARLEPILLAGKVQLVLTGHDHNYQHHFAQGIHYVITGGGGAPLYDLRPDTPYVKAARKAYHECEISVNGPVLRFAAVEPGGTVIERFEIRANR